MITTTLEYSDYFPKVLHGRYDITNPLFPNINIKDVVFDIPPIFTENLNLDKFFNVKILLQIPLFVSFGIIYYLQNYNGTSKEKALLMTHFFPMIFEVKDLVRPFTDLKEEENVKEALRQGMQKDILLTNNKEHMKEREMFLIQNNISIVDNIYYTYEKDEHEEINNS